MSGAKDVTDITFEQEVLNSDKVIYAKRMLTDLSVLPREDIPCTNCFVYKFLREKNYTLVNNA